MIRDEAAGADTARRHRPPPGAAAPWGDVHQPNAGWIARGPFVLATAVRRSTLHDAGLRKARSHSRQRSNSRIANRVNGARLVRRSASGARAAVMSELRSRLVARIRGRGARGCAPLLPKFQQACRARPREAGPAGTTTHPCNHRVAPQPGRPRALPEPRAAGAASQPARDT